MLVMTVGRRRGRAAGAHHSRGFTLMELLAVVLIITIFAALAIPVSVIQLRDRRVQEAARRIALVYREARLRALGRGSAVLVRIVAGDVTVHEAQVGTDVGGIAGCANLPVSSCLSTDWSSLTRQRVVDGFHVAASGELSDLSVAVTDSQNTAVPNLDICFTPMGRAFSRRAANEGTALTPLADTYVATVTRPGVTRARQVALLPNGTARLFAP